MPQPETQLPPAQLVLESQLTLKPLVNSSIDVPPIMAKPPMSMPCWSSEICSKALTRSLNFFTLFSMVLECWNDFPYSILAFRETPTVDQAVYFGRCRERRNALTAEWQAMRWVCLGTERHFFVVALMGSVFSIIIVLRYALATLAFILRLCGLLGKKLRANCQQRGKRGQCEVICDLVPSLLGRMCCCSVIYDVLIYRRVNEPAVRFGHNSSNALLDFWGRITCCLLKC